MKQFVYNHKQALLTLLFGIAVFIFWRIGYPQALSFSEELQLFLFDADYVSHFFTYPGGIAVGLGAFIGQFYASLTVGALILAFISVLLQRLTWLMARTEGASDNSYPLTFITPIALLHIMSDENILLPLPISISIALGVCLLWVHIQTDTQQYIVALILTPLLFWSIGIGAYIFVVYVSYRYIRYKKLYFSNIIKIATLLILLCTSVVVSYRISHYTIARVAAGAINFYRFKTAFVPAIALFALLSVILPCFLFLSEKIKKYRWATTTTYLLPIALLIIATTTNYTDRKYIIMRYDMLMRNHNWEGIIALAEQTEPVTPLEVYSVNFALAMQGQLPDRMFTFPQHSPQGLVPTFKREISYSLMANEVYFALGMVNTSQRFVFEAQEAIPNEQKSGRIMRRLAETNLILGHYDVAERYLRILQKTFAYSRWANEMMTYLGNENKIDAHPFYGKLRSKIVGTDFFYSDSEVDQMLGMLFVHNNSNTLALNYLLCYELLKCDIKHFEKYYPLTAKIPNYKVIPRAYQEALAYIWSANHNSFNGIPWAISEPVKNNFIECVNAYRNHRDLNTNNLKNTYWRYLLSK